MQDMHQELEGPAELALRPFLLRRLPERVVIALRCRRGNEDKVPHLQGQDPPSKEMVTMMLTHRRATKENVGR